MSNFPNKQEDVTIEVEVRQETLKAYLVSDDGIRTVWIPKSQIIDQNLKFAAGLLSTFVIPEWLAKDKEFC